MKEEGRVERESERGRQGESEIGRERVREEGRVERKAGRQ